MKINIFFNVNDNRYKKALIDYICGKYACFQVFEFEDFEEIAAYVQNKDIQTDVLITDNYNKICKHEGTGLFKITAVLNTNEFNEQNNINNNYCTIGIGTLQTNSKIIYLYKYQRCDDIINKIIKAFEVSYPVEKFCSSKNNISVVLGLHGGAGKSLVSASLSLMAVVKKLKSLYINFENLHYDIFCGKEEHEVSSDSNISNINIDKLVYYLKDTYSSFQAKAYTCILSSMNGVAFVKSGLNITDVSEISKEDADNFIKWIRTSDYNNIFFDLPVSIGDMTIRLLDFCDNIVLVGSRYGYYEEAGKIIEFINKRFEGGKILRKPNIIVVKNCTDINSDCSNMETHENNITHTVIPFSHYIPQRFKEADIVRAFENDKNFWNAMNKLLKMIM